MLDARSMRFETLQYGWDAANPLSGDQVSVISNQVSEAKRSS